jgi:hypothetical protein
LVKITVTDVRTGETKTRRIVTQTETTTGRTRVGIVVVAMAVAVAAPDTAVTTVNNRNNNIDRKPSGKPE